MDIPDGTRQFGVETKPNQWIDSLVFSEAGDFTLAGFGGRATWMRVRG